MITDMRDSVSSWQIKLVLILIIVSFISFYGWGSRSGNLKVGDVAQVNGESISQRDLDFQYQQTVQSYQQQGKLAEDIPEKYQEMIKQQLLTGLIYQKLKSSEAQKLGLVASDEKVKEIIKKQFSVSEGNFDFKLYENYLRNHMGKNPGQYEEDMRSNLRAALFEQLILETGLSSNLDLKNAYKQNNEKAVLSFVKLNQKNTAKFRPAAKAATDEELKKFYVEQGDQFKTKEKKQLDIAYLEQASFPKAADFAKEAESMLQDFSIKFENFADAKVKEPRLKRIETGMISYEDRVAPFTSGELTEILNSTLNLEKSKSTVLVSRDGKKVYLIKITDLQPSILPELATIRSQVEKAYIDNQNASSFDGWIQKTWAEVTSGTQTLASIAQKAGAKVTDTQAFAFSPANIVPEIGANEEIMSEAFKTKEKAYLSKPIKMGDDYVFAQLKSKIEPDWKKFETEQESLANVMHQQSAQARFGSWMKVVEQHAKVKQDVRTPMTEMPAF